MCTHIHLVIREFESSDTCMASISIPDTISGYPTTSPTESRLFSRIFFQRPHITSREYFSFHLFPSHNPNLFSSSPSTRREKNEESKAFWVTAIGDLCFRTSSGSRRNGFDTDQHPGGDGKLHRRADWHGRHGQDVRREAVGSWLEVSLRLHGCFPPLADLSYR